MKKIAFRAITIVVIAFLVSCGNKTKEADELRLQGEFEKAAELYEQAAKHGDGYAWFRLGNCYQTGLGVDKDEKKRCQQIWSEFPIIGTDTTLDDIIKS